MATDDAYARVKGIVLAALDLASAERSSFVDGACRGNPELMARVTELLDHLDGASENLPTRGALDAWPTDSTLPRTLPRHPGQESVPSVIGRYPILSRLGAGGMGVVYRARDPRLEREIALKVLPSSFTEHGDRLTRFRREARLLASINHPNIGMIHSLEEEGGTWFFTMEHVPGETLARRIGEAGLGVEETLRVGRQLASAVEAAHTRGVIHRDLKPLNVMVTPDGWVKVLDFGLAREGTSPASSVPGVVLGTPGYMSPEQVRGDSVDVRTDVWALACILYECLCGLPAFREEDRLSTMKATLDSEPAWDRIPPGTPDGIRDLLGRCLEKEVGKRVASASDVRRAIDEELETLVVPARARSHRTARPERRDRKPRSTNLPSPLTSFVGRDSECDEVLASVDEHRLVTLSGAGGCGKTRLALEVGGAANPRFPDGVWLVDLAPLMEADRIWSSLASVLGLKEGPERNLADVVSDHLRPLTTLLVLDNAERVLEGCAKVVRVILPECRDLRVLVTSRQPLGIVGEKTVRVPPLEVPTASQSVDTLSDVAAVRLFVERAKMAHGSFELSTSVAPFVRDICRQLDGIPLAIELAATRVRTVPLEELTRQLQTRLAPLRSTFPGSVPHHRTMETAIAWSFEHLSKKERALLRRLSVFRGGWTLAGAEAVCSSDGIEPWEVLDLLSGLVEKSLVEFELEVAPNSSRYRMLEPVRIFGQQQLDGTAEGAAVHRHHRDYYLAFAERAQPELRGSDQAHWIERAGSEHDNLLHAIRWSRDDEDRDQKTLRLVSALWRFWEIRGFWTDGRRLIREALEKDETQTPTMPRARALAGGGGLAYLQNDYETAQACHEACLEIVREVGDERAIASSLNHLANVAYRRGDFDRARGMYEENLGRQGRLGDRYGMGHTLNNLGHVALVRGDYEAAITYAERSLEIRREIGDVRGVADSLSNLGGLAMARGKIDLALSLFEQCLRSRRELHHEAGIANTLRLLGDLTHVRGDRAKARSLYEESRCLCQKLDDKIGLSYALIGMGNAVDDPEEALKLFAESLAINRQVANHQGVAHSLCNVGAAHLKLDEVDLARDELAECLRLSHDLGDKIPLANSFQVTARLMIELGRPREAARLGGVAERLMEEAGLVPMPAQREERHRLTESLRAELGEELLDAERGQGRGLDLEEAVNLGLDALGGGAL